jgi:hypothetical protein
VPERNTLNNDVKDIKHDDKDDFNLALTIENENDMGVDTDTNSLFSFGFFVLSSNSFLKPLISDANISKNGYSPANCPTITSNSFSNFISLYCQ